MNILDISVTDAVLNKGTDFNTKQLANMLDMFVTREVLNRGTAVSALHPVNI